MHRRPAALPTVATLLLYACGPRVISDAAGRGGATDPTDTGVDAPIYDTASCPAQSAVGWSAESHTKDVAGDYERIFPRDGVQRLDIVICAEWYRAMRDDVEAFVAAADTEGEDGEAPDAGSELDAPIYAEAAVSYGGMTWPYVGVRYKGNSSLRYSVQAGVEKLPLRLDFDEWEDRHPETDDQRFFGFKVLSLSPGYFDPAFTREKLVDEMLEAEGIPAARAAFYEVWIDTGDGPVYWGLYTVIEDPSNKAFLDRVFGENSGNLYKPESECATWECFDPENFEKQNHESAADWSDVEAAVAALHADRTDAAAWRAGLEASFDAQSFMRWLAVNIGMGNWDSYGQMPHNYFLYGDPAHDGRLAWIPWDHNMSLQPGMQDVLGVSLDGVSDHWPLIRFTMDDATYSDLYYDAIAAFRYGTFNLEPLGQRARALQAQVAPFVEAEEAPYTQLERIEDFEGSVDGATGIVPWAEDRHRRIDSALADRE